MALVPFKVNGPAAGQDLEERLLQVGPVSLLLRQRPHASGNTAHLKQQQQQPGGRPEHSPQAVGARPDLSRVGFVLWQSGLLLADLLLLRLQQGASGAMATAGGIHSWAGMRVLELGCGAGTTGMFLARAGAQVSGAVLVAC